MKKLDDRSRMLVHLGTEPRSKAYRLYDPSTRKVIVSRDVVFDEARGWNWNNEGTETQNDQSFVVKLGEFGNHGVDEEETPKTINTVTKTEEAEDTNSVSKQCVNEEDPNSATKQSMNEEYEEVQPLRRSERQTTKPKYLDDYILLSEELGEEVLLYLNNEPRNFGEAKGSKEWTRACEEEIESIVKNRTWDLVDLPYGAKPIGLKCIF